jgi:hypothetical protein
MSQRLGSAWRDENELTTDRGMSVAWVAGYAAISPPQLLAAENVQNALGILHNIAPATAELAEGRGGP